MMAKSRVPLSVRLTLFLLLSVVVAIPATAQVAKQGNDVLSSLAFTHDKLLPSQPVEPLDNVQSLVSSNLQNGWAAFLLGANPTWKATVDHRSGLIAFAEGGNIAWVPGRGNSLTNSNIASFLGGRAKPDVSVVDAIARNYLPRVTPLLGIDPTTLVLNPGRSGQPAGHVWFVDYDVVREGLPIENARVVFRVNNGNLIQFGTENVPSPGAVVPPTTLTRDQALAVVSKFVGGFNVADSFRDNGSLHLLPANVPNNGFAEGFKFGQGRGIAKVWQFIFHRDGVMGTWLARVDAATGEVLHFADVNEYVSAQVSGGTYLNSPTTGSEVVRPTPFANVSSGGFNNSGGVYNFTSGTVTSTLAGQFVKITDTCGAISQASDASGNIVFGTSTGTDCTTPGHGGAGNTHASREQFYQVNRIKEVVKGWLPANTWLTQQLTVNVNLNQTCNAYWNGSTLNFFKSGGGCANTGEIAGVSLHEFGHGIDQNDGTGTAPEGGTGESYGDTTAIIALHNSCLGAGFLSSNCGGYGDACTACTGVRDADFAKHASNTPATVANFTQVRCPAGSGPCGKEVHCESYVPTEAIWDFANRDLPGAGTGPAWTTLDRLWYLSRNTATSAFTCNHAGTPFTSNGCGTGNWWKVMRAVDDDDGNLTNGTPHGGALFAAFNRHGIACTTDAGASTSFAGCAAPATPTLSITAGSNSASLSWTASGSAVYDVFRNELGCNAGFTKISTGQTATTLSDAVLSNGLTYFYQVTAFPTGNEACASAPSTCISVTPTPITCTPPAAPTGLTSSGTTQTGTTISWTASTGATLYKILRSTTSGGPYTQVGTSATTSFADSGLTCGTNFFYVVVASNGTCDSGNSAQLTVTTAACPTCTPPAAPTGVTTSATTQTSTTVTWTAVSGATEYHVLRSTTSGGPYTLVGTVTGTSFVNTGLTCNTTYFYVVRAATSTTCESANSAQASATTLICTGCTTKTFYTNNFDAATGLSDWSKGTFVTGGSSTDWRGVQACTAHSGANIFRFGGSTCTAAYASNDFTFAQPNGAAGIAIPAGATSTQLSFWHRRSFESGFDGGTLTVSVDGTNYSFVPGTAILSGTTYNGTLSTACPPAGAGGASAFTGASSTFTNTTVNLDAACNVATGTTTGCAGRSVRIGFTAISDCSVTSTGWFLDDVTVTACTTP
ncbi:MAG: hypothetical protein JF614_04805 [Acidobacteria bacterium]|nr:hypothetical protein [Acidobacteriota bacterium]